MSCTIIGVDPGLVDTGIVAITFEVVQRWSVTSRVVSSRNHNKDEFAREIAFEVCNLSRKWTQHAVFVEEYRPRLKLQTDKQMMELQTQLRGYLPYSQFIPNQGIKQLITSDFMKLMNVWNFPLQPTHHQDLRSAARIALLGAIKSPIYAGYVNMFAKDHLTSPYVPWSFIT